MYWDRRTAAAAVAVLLLLGLFAWRMSRAAPEIPPADTEPPQPDAQQSRAGAEPSPTGAAFAAQTPSVAPAGSTPDTTAPPGTITADQPLSGQPQVVALGKQASEEYRRLSQYPPWSRPFNEEGEDPILRDRTVSPILGAGPNGEDPTLVVFPERTSFETPNPVLLYAYLSVDGTRVAAGSITGTIMSEDLQPLAELTYADDGSGGDPIAGDYLYTARFEPGPSFAPELSESFLVRVVAETSDGEQRMAATSFLYSNPHARLTGNYRDSIVDGNLVIDAEVEVLRAGRFHLEATLYSQDGRHGIGEAHTAGELGTGRQWMRLTFFGRVISQSQLDGPYLLRFVALSTTTTMPNAKNDLVENAHVTAPFRYAQFSNAPFNDPDLLDAADRLERDLRAP